MYSMTGYGRADLKSRKLAVSVEISSVNNRFLEFSFRCPRQLSFLEPRFKELIASRISRGKINFLINYEDCGIGIDKLTINRKLADEIYQELAALKQKYKLSGEIEVNQFLVFPDVFKVEKAEDVVSKVWPFMKRAVNMALKDLVAMRKQEGMTLKADLSKRLKMLRDGIREVGRLCPENVSAYREKLSKKVSEVTASLPVDGSRLEEEIALMAERCDITEECVRFASHIEQFTTTLKKSGSVGKRLNFLLQELNREANTIGAKAGNARISHQVVELKEEIEKMREQVQNIE